MPIEIDIPGFGHCSFPHLICDYNGTLAVGGVLLPGVADGLELLSEYLDIVVITADTFGKAASQLVGLPLELVVLDEGDEREAKGALVSSLGSGVIAVGNGSNDLLMLERASLAIAVLEDEGVYAPLLAKAHIVVKRITDALDLLVDPRRLKAILRF